MADRTTPDGDTESELVTVERNGEALRLTLDCGTELVFLADDLETAIRLETPSHH